MATKPNDEGTPGPANSSSSASVMLQYSLHIDVGGAVVWVVDCPQHPELHITGSRLINCRLAALEELRGAGVEATSVSHRLADQFIASDERLPPPAEDGLWDG